MRGCAGQEPTPAGSPPLPRPLQVQGSYLFFAPVYLARAYVEKAGARFGLALASGCLCLLKLSLDLSRLDRCQFGFGGRPLVFFRWCPDWRPPILKNVGWVWLRPLEGQK